MNEKEILQDALAAAAAIYRTTGDDEHDEDLTAEEDENGVVHLLRGDGSPVAMMSRETWDQLEKMMQAREKKT